MLYRKIEKDINDFIENNIYDCMLLVGVRQCGKTTLLKELFENKNMLYCNLEENPNISALFDNGFDVKQIIQNIEDLLNRYYDDSQMKILILDEIQVNSNAITALKYFAESDMNLKVIGSGSLLGVKLNRGGFSFPVGKVHILNMYPLDFEEFLINTNNERLVLRIKEHFKSNEPMINPIHEKLLNLVKEYLKTGGMPQIVWAYVNNNKKIINDIKNDLNISYQNDIVKYVETKDRIYISKILENLGGELLKENQKFKLSNIKSGMKYNQLENSFLWLASSEIVYKCSILDNKKINSPLKNHLKDNKFKLFYCDTALLINKMNYSLDNALGDDRIYLGLVIENYVAGEIYKNYRCLYNYNDNNIEVDFLIQNDNNVIPVEVKAANNTKSKSLKSYMERNSSTLAYRISEKNFGMNNNIKSIPLYACFLI